MGMDQADCFYGVDHYLTGDTIAFAGGWAVTVSKCLNRALAYGRSFENVDIKD